MFGLGRILLGIAAAAVAGIAAAVIIHKIHGAITKQKLTTEAAKAGLNKSLIESVNRCSNKVTLKDLYSDEEHVFEGDSIAREIVQGDVIYS